MYQLALQNEEASKKGRRAGESIKLVLVAHKADLINVGSAAAGVSYAAAVSRSGAGASGEKKPQPQARGEIATDRIRSILERELTKRANDLRNTVSIEGLGSDQPSPASGATGDQGVIDSSSGLTGLECVSGAGGKSDGFKFENWEYGEVDFVSSWVEVSRNEFTNGEGVDGEEKNGAEENARHGDGEDGLTELKRWLDQNLV